MGVVVARRARILADRAGVVALLRWFGIDESAAAAIALLSRAITLGSVIALGSFVTLGCRRRRGSSRPR